MDEMIILGLIKINPELFVFVIRSRTTYEISNIFLLSFMIISSHWEIMYNITGHLNNRLHYYS